MRSSLLAAALLLLAPHAASADCAVVGLTPRVINAAATLPGDGAFVVAADPEVGGKLLPGDVSIQSTWFVRSVKGANTYGSRILTIAPGLSLYRLIAATTEEIRIGPGDVTIATARRTEDKRPLLPAPAVKKLTHQLQNTMHRSESVTAQLDGAVPAGAIAIVMTDDSGVPRSFGRVDPKRPVQPFHSFDCTPLPNGTLGSKKGDKVKVYWVDDGGRRSPSSAAITIE